MESLSYSYFALYQESITDYRQWKLAFNSTILTKSTTTVLLALMMLLGLISNAQIIPAVEASTENNSTSTQTLLKMGSTGEEVKKLQQQLKDLKYFNQEITGYFGNITQEAVIAFQKANTLTADGVVGSATQSLINQRLQTNTPSNVSTPTNSNALSKGMEGEKVNLLQEQLIAIGAYNGQITGYFGSLTEEAVKKFQAQNGLTQDGIVNTATQGAINQKLQQVVTNSNNTVNTVSNTTVSNNTGSLKRESEGASVKLLQENLTKIGAYSGPVTGYFGSLTEEAVKKFQAQNGLTQDGIVNTATQGAINQKLQQIATNSNNTVALKRGDEGASVKLLQENLTKIGIYEGPVTGYFGSLTEEAVKKFQAQNGLTQDGIMGDRTQMLLVSKLANGTTQSTTNVVSQTSLNSAQIAQLQTKLQTLNFYQGKSDGIVGPGTIAAIKKFQIETNLPVTGVFDSATQKALNQNHLLTNNLELMSNPYNLSSNLTTQEIQLLQRRLEVAGLYKGKIDGVMGEETKEALEKARLAYGIVSTN
jgi:peptidoglycan hydrolase-like protein with peptidoglycan-binding domain